MADYIAEKIVKKYGNTLVVVLDKEDRDLSGVSENDTVKIVIKKTLPKE